MLNGERRLFPSGLLHMSMSGRIHMSMSTCRDYTIACSDYMVDSMMDSMLICLIAFFVCQRSERGLRKGPNCVAISPWVQFLQEYQLAISPWVRCLQHHQLCKSDKGRSDCKARAIALLHGLEPSYGYVTDHEHVWRKNISRGGLSVRYCNFLPFGRAFPPYLLFQSLRRDSCGLRRDFPKTKKSLRKPTQSLRKRFSLPWAGRTHWAATSSLSLSRIHVAYTESGLQGLLLAGLAQHDN